MLYLAKAGSRNFIEYALIMSTMSTLIDSLRGKMMRSVRATAVVAIGSLFAVTAAQAQAQQCAIPPSLKAPRSENPPPGSQRILPISGYVLALSWSPQFCKARGKDDKFSTQCEAKTPFGFILHGLWPDAEGQGEPRWCRKVPVLSKALVRQNFCATPSVQLLQREWAKHGSCITRDPAAYFASATRLFASIKAPDMNALSRSPLDVRGFTAAFVAANPGLPASAIRLDLSDIGWLEEVRICYGTDYRPRTCPRDISGAGDGARVRIWRTAR
jgi:ribonuclease T2